jgi:pimeloyl-ACP methyl ester carboxylesterase
MKLFAIRISILLASFTLEAAFSHTESPFVFSANDGTEVDAFKGSIEVPENRDDPKSRMIRLTYVRFPATHSGGTPTVYLAGGPGGSGISTAMGNRFPLFMQMREFGDVIAFDQRGTGESSPLPTYRSSIQPEMDQVIEHSEMMNALKVASEEASMFWRDQGIDLSGYNTLQSAKDIKDLAKVLGAERINLWGISYGSHLAMATIREMPGQINRVVMAAIEGLDQTVKLPSRTDAYFDRLQQVINQNPDAAARYPDIKGLMHHVFDTLEKNPHTAVVQNAEGESVEIVFGKNELQIVSAFMIADPSNAANLPGLLGLAAMGNYDYIAPSVYRFLKSRPIEFRGMPEAMDIMSGISTERLKLVRDQAQTSLLGDWLNYPMPHLVGAFDLDDLGDAFRAPVETDVPTLALSGTLDGRTFPEAAKEALAKFTNLQHIIVENGGHNVFMQDPIVAETILSFMRGDEVPAKLALPAPSFR